MTQFQSHLRNQAIANIEDFHHLNDDIQSSYLGTTNDDYDYEEHESFVELGDHFSIQPIGYVRS